MVVQMSSIGQEYMPTLSTFCKYIYNIDVYKEMTHYMSAFYTTYPILKGLLLTEI